MSILAAEWFFSSARNVGQVEAFVASDASVFEPNLIAPAPLVHTDMAVTALIFAAVYVFISIAENLACRAFYSLGWRLG